MKLKPSSSKVHKVVVNSKKESEDPNFEGFTPDGTHIKVYQTIQLTFVKQTKAGMVVKVSPVGRRKTVTYWTEPNMEQKRASELVVRAMGCDAVDFLLETKKATEACRFNGVVNPLKGVPAWCGTMGNGVYVKVWQAVHVTQVSDSTIKGTKFKIRPIKLGETFEYWTYPDNVKRIASELTLTFNVQQDLTHLLP